MGVLSLDQILKFFEEHPEESEKVANEEGGGINIEDIKQNWDKEGGIGADVKEAISSKFESLFGGEAGGNKRLGVVGDIAEGVVKSTCPLIHRVGCCLVQCLKEEKQSEVKVDDEDKKE